MKILCKKEHQQQLEKRLNQFQSLDLVLVEQGIDYVGLHYSFSMNTIEQVEKDLLEMISKNKYLIGIIGERIYQISVKDIVYIEGFSKEAYVYTFTKQYLSKQKLYELEELLINDTFIRISKSIVVNISHIDYMIPEVNMRYALYMKNGITLMLSRSYLQSFKERLKIR